MKDNMKRYLVKHFTGLLLITLAINFFMTWVLLFFHDMFSSYAQKDQIQSKLSVNTTHDILLNEHVYLYFSAYIVPIVIALLIQTPLLKAINNCKHELSLDNQKRLINIPMFLSKTVFFGWVYSIFQILMLIVFWGVPFNGFILTNLATQFTISIAVYSLTYFATDFYNKKLYLDKIITLTSSLIIESTNTLNLKVKIKTLFYSAILFPCALFTVVIYFIQLTQDSDFINEKYQVIYVMVILVIALGRLITELLLKNLKYSFNTINKATKSIEKGDYNVSLDVLSVDELGLLTDNLNHMAFEIKELNTEVMETQKEIVYTMGAIGETRSKVTGNHVKRVAEYSKIFALECGLSEKEANILKQASPMHDIGKVWIPDSVLNKPGRLTPDEREIMNTHANLGYEMLKNSERDILKAAAIVAFEHHEKWDGTGYPNKKIGDDIHIYGRITAIADVFDALGSKRVYKEAWEDERIFKLIKEEKGKHFDPKLVDIFFEKFSVFDEIRSQLSDL